MKIEDKIHIVFVCLGNICRSPLGEGIFHHLVNKRGLAERFIIDSAGTSSYHAGEYPDMGSRRIALKHGIEQLEEQRSRQFIKEDLNKWDYVIAMDASNCLNIKRLGEIEKGTLHLMRDFDERGRGEDVPDPYSQGGDAFQQVYDIVYRSCEALLDRIVEERGL